MSSQIQLRRDTAANWTSVNPTLAQGEIGIETNTGYFKIGNGSSAWNSLSYAVSQSTNTSASPTFAALTTTGNMVVGGDLTVNGNSTFINTETLAVEDNIILLNSGATGSPTLNAGIEVERGSSTNVVLRWNESTDKWQVSENGTDYYDVINSNSLETRFADEHWHKSVRLATAAVLPNSPTYTAGTLDQDGGYGIGAKLESSSNARLTVDGLEAVTGNRILVKNQANAKHNGVYDVTAQGSGSAHWILTRAADMNGSYSNQIDKGETVGCQEGNDNYYQQFYVSSTGTGTDTAHIIGTDDITFSQFSGTASFNAGSGLTVSGNTLNILSGSSSRIDVTASSIDLAAVAQSDTSACPGIAFVSSITRDEYGRILGVESGSVLVELGTNTSGNYVSSLVAGTGIGLANNSGESASPTISIGQDVATSASVTFAKVTAPLTGNVTGNVTGDVTGNASTASTLQTARAISLNGDISGSASFNGSSDITISATVQPNSVALGTDTTGNYVASLVAGNAITLSNNTGEGATPTIAVTANTYDAYGAATTAQSAAASYTDSAIAATNLDGLNNVTVPSPSAGDYLKWSGTAWINDPINLGTDTTGNYMSDLTQGTGVSITHTPGEGSNATIAIGQDVATSASPTFATLNLNGDLVFEGATPNTYETTLTVVDPTADRTISLPNIDGTVVTTGDTGTVTSTMIADGTIVNADINSSAAIAISKLASGSSGQIVLANGSGVPAYTTVSGDVTVDSSGVTAISSGVVVNADINASAAIALSKLASGTSAQVVIANGSGVPTYTTVSGDVTVSNTGVTSIGSGVIVDADISSSAGIALSKLATSTAGNIIVYNSSGVPTAVAESGDISISDTGVTAINSGVIVDADVNASAAISHSKLANATPGQVLLGTTTSGVVTATTISGDITINGAGVATIAANSVALGTDTTGDYVASLVQGTGITLTNNSGESATPTIAIGQSVATTASVTFAQVETTGSMIVGQNLYVSGSVVTQNQTSLQIDDPFIYLASSGSAVLTDFGIAGNYNDGTYRHGGIFRDATDGKWKFFDSYTPEPTDPIDTGHASYAAAPLVAKSYESTVATGTAPFTVSSTTAVTNLNADYLDGQHGSYYAPLASPTFTGTVTLPSGTVTSAMILDGTIVDADINASAAIALSKLASGTSAQVIMANGSGVPTYTTISGDITISSTGVATIAANSVALGTDTTGNYMTDVSAGTGITISHTPGEGSTATISVTSNTYQPLDADLTAIAALTGSSGFLKSNGAGTWSIDTATYLTGSNSLYVGTTQVALNRSSANLALTGISSVTLPGSTSGTVQLIPTAAVGTGTILTIPATTGTIITTGDSGTVTSTMLAGSIADTKLSTISTAGKVSNSATTATDANTASAIVARDSSGNFTAGTITATAIATAATYIGTTQVALNRSSANLALTGISSVALPGSTSGTITLQATATAGTNTITLPAATGTVVTTGDTGSVTSTMIADGTIVNGDISTTAAIDLGKLADVSTSAQTASYTLVLTDKNKIVELSNASANTLTIPPNSSVAFPVGSQITFIQTGAGQTTITPGAGVTINGTPGLKLRAQWSSATLIKRATDTWVALGDLSA